MEKVDNLLAVEDKKVKKNIHKCRPNSVETFGDPFKKESGFFENVEKVQSGPVMITKFLSYQQGYTQFVYKVDKLSTKSALINRYHYNIKDQSIFQQKA